MTYSENMAAVGQGMGGLGTMVGGLANIYGTYRGLELQQKQFEDDQARRDKELERMRMMDALSKRQLDYGNLGQFQQLAMNQEDRLQDTYGSYNASIGR